MNRTAYRIIFNACRGQLMAVAETACSHSAGGNGQTRANTSKRGQPTSAHNTNAAINRLQWAIWTALGSVLLVGMTGQSANAQKTPSPAQLTGTRIVADPTTPGQQQATILKTGNGTVQVNIQTPSSAGVSRNTFSQFDVGTQGVVINNSRTATQSSTGGAVQANPWLAKGSAQVILNEVNSRDPSQLHGVVEVAGQRAEVIIANPAGIQVNGGSFLNASRVTLTTGTALFNDKGISGFKVTEGLISIDGKGLSTLGSDYTSILSRAAQINAGVWAQQLRVATGQNTIDTQSDEIVVTASKLDSQRTAAPRLALDVTHLGGMYAGKIMLIGTEAGLGVNNAGLIQSTRAPLTLDHNGWLSNSGTFYSHKDTRITTQGQITHSGTIAAQGTVQVQSRAQTNDGAPAILGTSSSLIASGLQTDGTLLKSGAISLNTNGNIQLNGQLTSLDDIQVHGAKIDATASQWTGQKIVLNTQLPVIGGGATTSAGTGINATSATLTASHSLEMSTSQTLRTDQAKISSPLLQVNANNLSNRQGSIKQTGPTPLALKLPGLIDNTGGTIASNSTRLDISAERLTNDGGLIQHAGNDRLNIQTPQLQNLGGNISTAGHGQINTTSLHNSGTVYALKNLDISTTGELKSTGPKGVIAAQGNTQIDAQKIGLDQGSTIAAGLGVDGQLIRSANTDNGQLKLTTTGDQQLKGNIFAAGRTHLTAQNIGIDGQLMTGGALDVTSRGNILLNGTSQSGGNTQFKASQKIHQTGSVTSGGDTDMQGPVLMLTGSSRTTGNSTLKGAHISLSGNYNTGGNLDINSTDLLHISGDLTSGGNANMQGQALILSGNTRIGGNSTLKGDHVSLSGNYSNTGNLDINSTGGLSLSGFVHSGGNTSLYANQHIGISGHFITNGSLLTGSDTFALNTGAQMTVGQNANITANKSVAILGNATAGGMVSMKSEEFDLSGGIDAAATELRGKNITLGTAGSTYSVRGSFGLDMTGTVTLRGGLSATDNLAIVAGTSATFGGDVTAGNNLSVNAGGDIHIAGNAKATGSAQINASGNTTITGQFSGSDIMANGKNLQINGPVVSSKQATLSATENIQLDNSVNSQGALTLQAGGNINAQKSFTAASVQTNSQNLSIGADLSSGGQTRLGTTQKIQIGGQLNSLGGLLVRAGGNVDIGKGIAAGSIDLKGQNVTVGNTMTSSGAMLADTASLQVGGDIQSGQDMRIKATTDGVTAKTIVSLQNLNLTAQGPIATDNISAKQSAQVQSQSKVGSGTIVSGGPLHLVAQDDITAKHIYSGGTLTAQTQGSIQTQTVQSEGQLTLNAAQNINIQDRLATNSQMSLKAGQNLHVQGSTQSGERMKIEAKDIRLNGQVLSGADSTIDATNGRVHFGSTYTSHSAASVTGQSITLQGAQSQGDMSLHASGGSIVSSASIIANGKLDARSDTHISVNGHIASGGNMQLQAGTTLLTSGMIVSGLTGANTATQNMRINAGGDVQAQHIQSRGHMQVQSDGHIHTGAMSALGNLQAQAQDDILATQGISGQNVQVTSQTGHIGTTHVVTQGHLDLQAAQNIEATDILVGNHTPGSATANATLQAGGHILAQGSVQSTGHYTALAGTDYQVQGDTLIRGHGQITAGDNISHLGQVQAGAGLQETAGQDIWHTGQTLVRGDLQLQSGGSQSFGFSMTRTQTPEPAGIVATGSMASTAGSHIQVAGQLLANGSITLTAGQPQAPAAQSADIRIGSHLASLGDVKLHATGSMDLLGNAQMANGHFTADTGSLRVDGDLEAQNTVQLKAHQDIDLGGQTFVRSDLSAQSETGSIQFADRLQVGGNTTLNAHQDLNLAGPTLLLGDAHMRATTGSLNNNGPLQVGQTLVVDKTAHFNNQSTIQSVGGIDVRANRITSNTTGHGGLTSGQNMQLTARDSLHLGGLGQFTAVKDITTSAQTNATQAGQLQAGQAYTHSGVGLSNSGTLNADEVAIQTSLNNTGGVYGNTIYAGDTSNNGYIVGGGIALGNTSNTGTIQGSGIVLGSTTNSGRISSLGSVNITGDVTNSAELGAAAHLSVFAGGGSVNNTGQMTGSSVNLQGQDLTNAGQIQATGALDVNMSGSINNTLSEGKTCIAGPAICSQQAGARPLTDTDYRWSQSSGTLYAGGAMNLSTATLTNQGTINSKGSMTIAASTSLNNTRSTNDLLTASNAGSASPSASTAIIASGGSMTLSGGTLSNSGGQIMATGQLSATFSGAITSSAPAAPGGDLNPVVQGSQLTLTGQSITNQGRMIATGGNATLTATGGAITNSGSATNTPLIAATGSLTATASGGAITNSKGASLLGGSAVTLTGDSFTNSGTVYGTGGAAPTITITSSGAFSNSATGAVVAGSQLNINANSYSNQGSVGSKGNVAVTGVSGFDPVSDNIIAMGTLDLGRANLTVAQGKGWSSGASHVTWGTLTNYGTVFIAGSVTGNVINHYTGNTTRNGKPNMGDLAGSYKYEEAPDFDFGDKVTVNSKEELRYTDVLHRAVFISAGVSGNITNTASDVGGGGGYTPVPVAQTITWKVNVTERIETIVPPPPPQVTEGGVCMSDCDALPTTKVEFNTYDREETRSSQSLARLKGGPGSVVTLTGPETGTIVGSSITIKGGDLTLNNSSAQAPNSAAGTQVTPGTASTVNKASTQTATQSEQAQRNLSHQTTAAAQTQAMQDFAKPATHSFTPGQAAPLPDTGSGSGSGSGSGFTYTPPAPTAPGQGSGVAFDWRDLGLSAPQAAAAAMHGSPPIPRFDWAALAPVTGSVKADNLTLDLTGTFKNIGPLVVSNALTINAAKGVDNRNASIHTGTLNINSHDGWLNNTNGQINAQSFKADIAGQLNNNQGKISVVGNAHLKTGDVVASNGSFKSTNGNFTLDSTGNITFKASTLSADQGLLKLKAAGNIDLGFIQGPRTTSTTTERLDDPTVIRPGGCGGSGESEYCTTDQLISAGSTVKTQQSISDTFQGTELSGANIQLSAGKDLTVSASDLQSTGRIDLSALGQVSVGAAVGTTDTTHTQTRSNTQLVDVWDGGEGGSSTQHLQTTTSTQTTTGTQQFAQGSDISAQGKLTIQSGADMAIDSSALKGEQGVALLSAGDLNIGGQHLKGQSTESKPATAGQQATTTAKETQTFAGSTISSGSGSVTAAALGDVSVSGSTLAAEQNINLIGDSVSVNAQVNTTTSKEVRGNPYGGRHWQTTDKQTQTLAGGKLDAGQDINVIAGMSAELGYQVGLLTSPTSVLPERANPTPNASPNPNSGRIALSGAQLSAGTPDSKNVGQEAGQVNLLAQGDIDIGTVEVVNKSDTFKFDKSSNIGGNTTTTQRTVTETHTQVGTSVGADPINVAAGGNLNMTGSAVSAAGDARLAATGNVTVQAATNTETRYTEDSKRSSGITSSGGFGIHIGSSSQKSQAWLDATSQSQGMSLVGSTEGDVRIVSGKTYTQQGSDVLTPQGDIAILAKSVNIEDGRDKLHLQTKQEFKQSGLTVALSGGILDTLTATGEAIEGVTGDGSNRNKTLNALIAYGKANDLIVQGKAVGNAAKQNGVLNSEGKTDAAAASGIKVSIGVGSSSSNSQSDEQFTKGTGSTIKAAGNVIVIATEGDLNVQGSRVQAKNDLALMAANNVNIVASSDTQTHRSSNESSSASVGVSFGVGSGSAGVSLDIAASKGKGQANSDSTTSQSSQVAAGQRVTIISGQDTNIQGGNVQGKQVVAHVGGDLNIESLQDTSTSQANQKTTGVALSIPITGAGGGASISQSKQNNNSNYQGVGQQSGISAGEGGFQINVKNNTDLKGAAIASKASADKNSLNTGTLTTSDIHNTMSASASSSGTSVGTHMVSGKYELGKAVVGNALNNGSADQSDASTTKTAISGAQVTVNGVTTDTSKEALTDSDGKFVETDTKNSHRSLLNTDIANLQQEAQQEEADNMLGFKTVTTFTDEANRTLYKVGAQVYRVPPGCSDKSCAVLLDEQETKNLELSQDGKVHLSNNGILNDLDGAVKYAQQHGGKSNPDGSKDYSDKPNNQYIVFAPEANNPLSELMIAGVQKSGLTPYVGLTNAEEKTSELVQQTTRQGNSIDIDSHSRGTLTTDNALQSINNQGGITDGNGNTIKPSIRLNNYGGAQNNESGNKTLQQVTGNENAQINSVVHPKDLVGASVVVGHNPATPNYSSKGTQVTNVESKDDGKGFFSNLWNILFGKATPHNCYGTSGGVAGCDDQWKKIPTSNTKTIDPNPAYKAPVMIPQYQQVDKVTPQVQQDSNAQMNQLLQATTPTLPSIAPIVQPNDKVETLQNFKQMK